jgi:predicted ArsR family transcriptional regulator
MPQHPVTRDAIKRVIKDLGPMTYVEIAQELGLKEKTVSSCISTSRSGKTKHFYVVDYRPQIGRSGLPVAVFQVGSRKDAPFPETDRSATSRRYYQNHKAQIKLRRGAREITPFTSLIIQVTR